MKSTGALCIKCPQCGEWHPLIAGTDIGYDWDVTVWGYVCGGRMYIHDEQRKGKVMGKTMVEKKLVREVKDGLGVGRFVSLPRDVPEGTPVVVTWKVPEPEPAVTCCPTSRRAIYRGDGEWRAEIWMSDLQHWEDHAVVACPFCGEELP